ncbi:hypothetical protein DOM22_06250 [Bdellovibrio sp. ZAP7]|uniref:DUF6635 family protein n=1 Tax=Bdellovibrio sp. ZAP7 TaxID=2231053 RepID=UPI00115BF2CA|nr:DUF6635 family protein [Bdellovibrio sp. ZAP7]QDK44792.1 hypothetical protein DOM22_06250 [Bdellovibrio sp. ZAP7]
MKNAEKNVFLGAIDEILEEHFEQKKNEVPVFVSRHFSLGEALKIQRQSVLLDLIFYPLNALWAIPFLTAKKGIEIADKLGWSQGNSLIKKVPAGFKTRYQKVSERILLDELLASSQDEVFQKLQNQLQLESHFSDAELTQIKRKITDLYKEEVDKFSSAQVLVTDLITTVLSLCVGKMFFNDGGLGVTGMGSKIARNVANKDAADHFVFGKKLGSAFYNVFPVAPTQTQVVAATLGVGVLLTVCSIAVAVFSDPLRKALGIQDYKLTSLVQSLEQNLYVLLKNEIKNKMKQNKVSIAA